MTTVKAPDEQELHVLALMGGVMGRVRALVASEDLGGLRASHFRVLAEVPGDGITITELAERLGMTKQGCGQLVTGMVERGVLATGQDPADRRVRIVTTTALGRRTNAKFERRVAQLERDFAATVGSRRYATFRAVLAEIAGDRRPS